MSKSVQVLSSIYLSVANSLPSTPSIKPVEWWLLFNLIYPFLIIVTSVLMQVLKKFNFLDSIYVR